MFASESTLSACSSSSAKGYLCHTSLRFAFILLLLSSIAHANPEFVGLLTTKDVGKLYVVVVAPGVAPQWAPLGGTIGGYFVSEYRPTDEVLLLRKDGEEIALKLKSPRVLPAGYSEYSGQPLPLESATHLIASGRGWDSGVSYRIFRDKDGHWCLSASKKDGKRIAFRFVLLTKESIPVDYLSLESKESRPWPMDAN